MHDAGNVQGGAEKDEGEKVNLIISFSAREDGNCGEIARYIARAGDEIVHFAGLHAHGCCQCAYECFGGVCPHRKAGVHALYQRMTRVDRTYLIVPMYGGNPSSLYFAFCERGQDFFRDDQTWDAVLRRLYIIGVYGSQRETPDFLACLNRWFAPAAHTERVLGLERHLYGQRMGDCLLDAAEARERIDRFIK